MSTNEFRSIRDALAQGRAAQLIREVDGRPYVRRFVPSERLIILGGGHVSQALCTVAATLDFAVTVVDDRPEFADAARFPGAQSVRCGDFEAVIDSLGVSSGDYVCIVTRGHRWDDVCLRRVLQGCQPSYLGMIGSHRRVAAQLENLAEDGFDRERIASIHTPIGLDIGAITPAEIAVSICAQLVQHRRSLPAREKLDGLLQETGADPQLLRYLAEDGEPKALLLVLSTAGSTPAKPGALMAVNADGRGWGTIGGGWGEADAMARARKLIGTGRRDVVRVNMNSDVAANEGMACGGSMTVLIEDAADPA